MYKLYVRDQYLNKIAEIDDYQSFDFVQKFNTPGTWVLELPTQTIAAKELVKKKAGIIVQKGNQVIFNGIVTLRNRKWNAEADVLTVSGYDDLIHLHRALAYPVPLGPPYTAKAYDVRTGLAEAVIKQYVDVNIGAGARSDRKVLAVDADRGLGKNVTGRARFHNLNDLISSLAKVGGDLGYKVTIKDKQLVFQVYQSTNKTKEVIFSPLLGNLVDFEYNLEDPEVNYAIVGGGGEGTSRTLLERGDSTSIAEYGRIEAFIDRRDTTELAELTQAMDEELTSKSLKTSLSISPIDTEGMMYGVDYNLGDKVAVILTQGNEVIKDVIREVRISINDKGETITPVVGTPESIGNPLLKVFNSVKKAQRQISNLERR